MDISENIKISKNTDISENIKNIGRIDISEILGHCDHTCLAVTSTWEDIQQLCDEGIEYHTASVCIPPCFVKQAHEYASGKVHVCTVIGFPNGYNDMAVKFAEASLALENGADEIDMVINIGALKAKRYQEVFNEIAALKSICGGKILKVIIETCLLTTEEKIIMCDIVSRSGADFIKTSTGFSTGGATFDDIVLFSENVAPHVKIKAAGGIRTLEDAERFLRLGASRLGTSSVVKLAKKQAIK